MAEIKTRIALKIDTYENWTKEQPADSTVGANLVLKRGEIGLCEIPSKNEEGKPTTAPTVLFKVGDGTTPFSGLNWASALAADVYSWAKAENVVLDGKLIKFKSGTGENEKVIKSVDLSTFALVSDVNTLKSTLETADADLSDRIDVIEASLGIEGNGKSLAEQISEAIATETQAREAADLELSNRIGSASVKQVGNEGEDGYVAPKAASGVYVDIEKAQSDVDTLEGVVTALSGTVDSGLAHVEGLVGTEATNRDNADKAILATIGTVTEGKTVVGMISDAQTAAETKVTTLENGTVKSNTDRIKAIEDDYLTSTDKSTLEAADSAILGKIGTVAEGKTVVGLIGEAQTAAQGYADEKAGDVQDNLDTHVAAYDLKVKALDDEDARIAGLVSKEVSDREGEIARVEGLVSAEETARKNAVEDLQTKINNINTNIASGLHFVGIVEKLEDVETPANGDICIVGTQEYIYVEETSKWEPLGEAAAHATYEYVNTELAEKADKGTYEAKVADLEQADKDLEQAYKDADTALENKLTPLINGKVAQGDFDTLEDRVDGHDTAIAGKVDQSAYDTKIGLIDAKDAEQDGKILAIETSLSTGAIHTEIDGVRTLAQQGVDNAATAQGAIDTLSGKIGTIEGEKTLVEQLAAVKATADAAAVKSDVEAAVADINAAIDGKVDKEGYIAFTQAEQEKLAGLENYDDTALSNRVTALEGTYTDEQVDNAISTAVNTEKGRAEGAEAALSARIAVFETKFGGAEDILVFDCGSSTEVI